MGDRVRFHRAVDLYPTDYIEADERGIVSHVDAESGTASVLLEGLHNGLGDNTLALTPHHDDHTLSALETFKPRRGVFAMRGMAEGRETAWGVVAGLATLLVTVPLSLMLFEVMPERVPAVFFILGVAWVAVAVGMRSGLVLAAVTPFVYNVLIIPPQYGLTVFTAWEWVLVGTYLATALIFPSAPRALERLKQLRSKLA
jgi:K+-sensing histidine kinase KdpD